MNVYRLVSEFYTSYRGEKRVVGTSLAGRNIYAMFVGSHAGKVGIATYAMHAREYITAHLAMHHVRRGVVHGGVWILPLVNPDGACLVQEGAASLPPERRGSLVYLNGGEDFSLWKANARAVDLNVNFDAEWGTGASNVRSPAPANYIGTAPFSEPETQAVRDFTLEVAPSYTVSYHTKGEVIYWRFGQRALRAHRDRRYANVLSAVTGYPLAEAPRSAGGYKDWCIQTLKIPSFTIEAGREAFSHPLGESSLPDLLTRNVDVLVKLAMEF